jgi:hypothetical protein
MTTRVLIAAIAGAIVAFVWGYVSHEVLPLGSYGMQDLPDDDKTVAAL